MTWWSIFRLNDGVISGWITRVQAATPNDALIEAFEEDREHVARRGRGVPLFEADRPYLVLRASEAYGSLVNSSSQHGSAILKVAYATTPVARAVSL